VYSHPSKARPIESTEVSPVTCDQDIALQADGGDKNWSIFFGEYQGRVDRLGDRLSGSEVHPYHLLRYDRVIFSQPAIEKLQLSLKNTVSKRRQHAAEGAAPKKTTRRKRARHEKAAEVA